MTKRASSDPQPVKGSENWKVLPKGTSPKTIVAEVKKAQKKRGVRTKKIGPKHLRYVKEKVAGRNDRHAVLNAGITKNPASADVIGHHLSKDPTIQEMVARELTRQGITITAVVKPIAEGLEAVRDVYDKEGNWVDSSVDHSIRLKSSGMALDLMGARNRGDTNPNVHFHLHAQTEQDEYGGV